MFQFFLTLLAGAIVGYLFFRLKVPGGVLVGSIIGAAILNIVFSAAFVPFTGKILAQVTAGAFIGSTVEKDDLRRLRLIWRPAFLLLSLYLFFNLLLGIIIYLIGPLDLRTSFFCATPGGLSDIPLIASDMGADPAKVVVLQFARMIIATGLFPSMINWICKKEHVKEYIKEPVKTNSVKNTQENTKAFIIAASAAIISGLLGYMSKIPAGALVFPLFTVIFLKMLTGKVYLPMWTKRMAQILSGAYIGSMFNLSDIIELRRLALPALLIIAGYTLFCFLGSFLLRRYCAENNMTRKEALLAATPSGASDMALISLDMGVQSTDVVLLQVIRLIVVIAIFPQIIGLVCIIIN